jgi:ribosomal protein S18 acetylase RimI-like enzyme
MSCAANQKLYHTAPSSPKSRFHSAAPLIAAIVCRHDLRYQWNVTESPIQVRLLTADDAEPFRTIRLEALRNNPEAFGSTFEAESVAPLRKYIDWFTTSQIYGAFEGGELVGIAALKIQEGKKEAHKGSLLSVYVRAQARGKGVGRLLIETIVQAARQQIEILLLAVVSDNHEAIRLYERLGFVAYGRERNSLKWEGRYFDEILMAKDLLAGADKK